MFDRAESNEALQLRVWCLFLAGAADAAGYEGLDKRRFHRVLFLSFALIAVYDLKPLTPLVMRSNYGPFYPDAEWQLGRLVGMRHLTPLGFRLDRADSPATHVHLHVTSEGLSAIRCLRKIESLQHLFAYLHDLTFACANVSDDIIDNAFLKDATYQQEGVSDHQVLRFSDVAENWSYQSAMKIQHQLGSVAPPSKRDLMSIYAAALERRVA